MTLEPIIGLEVHAQIATSSKLWCGCSNADFGAEPNTLVCPVCTGYPGALPVLNEKALELGIKSALALNCEIPENAKFDRKNYFYPDLPMGYQISQYDQPISKKGFLEITMRENCGQCQPCEHGEPCEKKYLKKIGITRVHLENDAGKLMHEGDWSLVDFNRSGSPLMEIVTDPDLRSPAEAKAFAEELQKVLQTVGSSEASMFKGQMRFDASISLRPKGEKKLYPRTEIKNLNSFRFLEMALTHQIKEQTRLWEEGKPLEREITVGWIAEEERTQMMREKESASDYRYFPEPDVPPLHVSKQYVESLRQSIPELPDGYRERLIKNYELTEKEAEIAVSTPTLGRFFEAIALATKDPKHARSFVFSVLLAHLNEDAIDVTQSKVKEDHLVHLIKAVNEGKVSMLVAKEILEETYLTGKDPLVILKERGLEQVSDKGELEILCDQVLVDNEKIVADFKGGKEKAFGALVGKVMALTKGKGNPVMVSEILRERIKRS